MKRFLLIYIMVVVGLSAFSQSPSRIINLQPAYPLVVGERHIDSVSFDNNTLNLADTPLDSLPHYEIGQIFEQTVRFSEKGHGFYVKADSLHSPNVTYHYEFSENSEHPKGIIEFNEVTGRFKYFPSADDYKSFTITFRATNGTESISEDVVFRLMPQATSEITIFHSEGTMPDASDYTITTETSATKYINNQERTAYSISISGKDVIFDDAIKNKVWGLSGREDIYELNIYAERLIIRSALKFPQSNITIYAKELIFDDKNGIVASINTSPSSEKTLTDGQGVDGGNAGNILLNIKEIKSNYALRFILNGADGQSTNRNGTPGDGGNGGNIRSTVDVSAFCDLARGSAGVGYDVDPDNPTRQGPPASYGEIGNDGSFVLVNKPQAYLHPYYLSAVMRHANDAFINNCTEYVLQICHEYRTLINETLNSDNSGENEGPNEGVAGDWDELLGSRTSSHTNVMQNTESLDWFFDNDTDAEVNLELQKSLLEIGSMLFRLEQGLDYFGNPDGWVPLLSFEVYLANYNNEIDRAIPTLYMYYWLNHIDQTLQRQIQACEFAANTTEQEISSNQELLNSLVREIPVIQDEADAISAMIEDLTRRIEDLQNQLLAQATKSVKRRHWLRNLFGIGSAVAKVVSFVPGWGTTVGSGLNLALNIASTSLDYSTGDDYTSALNMINTDDIINNFNEMKTNLTNAKTSIGQKDLNGLFSACNSFLDKGKLLVNNINNAYTVLSNNKVSDSEVQAEYNRLIANSPEWNKMKGEIDELNIKKTELLNHMNEVCSNMTSTMSELSSDILALDAFKRNVFTGNSKRDLNAMLYIEKMKQRAKDRLLLYDYYLRKAYEYRLLKPYSDEEFNASNLFERLEKGSLALDSVVDFSAYNTLGSVYRERISEMVYKITEEYTYNQPEKKNKVPITISKDQLDAINSNGSTIINLYEMDYNSNFFQDEENIRIESLDVKYVKAHAIGSASRSRLGLEMKHNGMSLFRKDGRVHWYDHMSRNSTNPHFWRTTINFNDVTEENYPETHQNSVAISSLLKSILNNNDEAVMLFSRPSAWSDITLSKQVQTNGDDIVIDSLVLELVYNYTLRADNIRNIVVTANNGLKPYFACSTEDITGKSSGNGPLYRSYRASSQSVSFTATEKYETYYFINWTDQAGRVVSIEPELTISRSKDQYYIANYERRVPILDVPDTIRVSNAGQEYIVNVSNIGSGDTTMDWYVENMSNSWIKVSGTSEGIDNGTFIISCETNTKDTERIDSLTIFAPECDMMSRKIYVLQSEMESPPVILKADDLQMTYGDPMPEFSYKASGAILIGEPEINCDVTTTSPVGTYDIIVMQGSVENPNVTFVNGTLTINKAPLDVKVGSYIKEKGEDNPIFTLTYEGFKNDETEDVLISKPILLTTATKDSEPGEYEITISGGAAQNYELIYHNGTLTISEVNGIIDLSFGKSFDIYDLYGNKIRSKAISLDGLPKGIYIVNRMKVYVK